MREERIRHTMTLATEMLHEIKMSARRWFIAFIFMCALEICTIAFFVWYMSLPTDTSESTTIEQEASDSDYNTFVGGDYNGKAENN